MANLRSGARLHDSQSRRNYDTFTPSIATRANKPSHPASTQVTFSSVRPSYLQSSSYRDPPSPLASTGNVPRPDLNKPLPPLPTEAKKSYQSLFRRWTSVTKAALTNGASRSASKIARITGQIPKVEVTIQKRKTSSPVSSAEKRIEVDRGPVSQNLRTKSTEKSSNSSASTVLVHTGNPRAFEAPERAGQPHCNSSSSQKAYQAVAQDDSQNMYSNEKHYGNRDTSGIKQSILSQQQRVKGINDSAKRSQSVGLVHSTEWCHVDNASTTAIISNSAPAGVLTPASRAATPESEKSLETQPAVETNHRLRPLVRRYPHLRFSEPGPITPGSSRLSLNSFRSDRRTSLRHYFTADLPPEVKNQATSSISDIQPQPGSTSLQPSHLNDLYRVRRDNNVVDTDVDSLAAIPAHLPNSPLCPRNPKNKSGGLGICAIHGARDLSSSESSAEHPWSRSENKSAFKVMETLTRGEPMMLSSSLLTSEFELRTPEHAASSPLCVAHPANESGGLGYCAKHSRIE